MHFAYLDEFGHIGPYISPEHPQYNASPVFGLGGIILPASEIRGFSTWFYQRKCQLLGFEIERAKVHPAEWEKKGAALYTTQNILRYAELQHFTNRLFNRIANCGGRIFYVGLEKTTTPEEHQAQGIYRAVLREALKRLDQFCSDDCEEVSRMLVLMDQHPDRAALVKEASRSMFNPSDPRKHFVEPPVQVESHRYQTLQAADWICALIGRVSAFETDRVGYAQFEWAGRLFGQRILRTAVRSSIRRGKAGLPG